MWTYIIVKDLTVAYQLTEIILEKKIVIEYFYRLVRYFQHEIVISSTIFQNI